MSIRFLKKMVMVLAVMFVVQGCTLYVEDDDGYYRNRHRHHFHHGEWEDRHSSLPPQRQMTENGAATRTSDLNREGKLESKPLAESG